MKTMIKLGVMALLAGGTLLASAATFMNVGAQSFEHPEGLKLRQESARTTRGYGFFPMYVRTHDHRGGGLAGGK